MVSLIPFFIFLAVILAFFRVPLITLLFLDLLFMVRLVNKKKQCFFFYYFPLLLMNLYSSTVIHRDGYAATNYYDCSMYVFGDFFVPLSTFTRNMF